MHKALPIATPPMNGRCPSDKNFRIEGVGCMDNQNYEIWSKRWKSNYLESERKAYKSLVSTGYRNCPTGEKRYFKKYPGFLWKKSKTINVGCMNSQEYH